MATLYISEYGKLTADVSGTRVQAVQEPAITDQVVDISAASLASQPFSSLTHIIRVHTDGACHIIIGTGTPTATTSRKRMAAGQTEYFGVQPGHRIAVIQGT